jgi:small-conductance mechanosensitive channel
VGCVLVGVVVGLVVCDVLTLVVAELVIVLVNDVVGLVVGDVVVVGEVVGVVTSQPWKPPTLHTSSMTFKLAADAPQSLESKNIFPNAHSKLAASPAGPVNSDTA